MEFNNCPDVRLAEPQDIPEIMRLTKACLRENYPGYPASEAKVASIVALHYNKNGGVIGVVGPVGGPLSGAVVMAVRQQWYSDDYALQEMILFVDPEHRKSTYAKQLMQFAKKAAEALGLELMIGVWSHNRTEAKVRLYKRQFTPVGAFFSHNSPHV